MATVLDLATDSASELGYLSGAETLNAADGALYLRKLNQLLDQMAAERQSIYQITRATWSILASTASYTVGTGGTVNIARPVYIDHVGYIDTAQDPDREYQLAPLTPED